jgi:translation initiation factor IF-1
VKDAVNKYDDVLMMRLKTVMRVMGFWGYFSSGDKVVVELSGNDNTRIIFKRELI